MCGKEISGNTGGGREAEVRGIGKVGWGGMLVCSLGFQKDLPASQSVSHKSPRVALGVVCGSFPESLVTMVSGSLHHIKRTGFSLFSPKTPSPRKTYKVICQGDSYATYDPRITMKLFLVMKR